MLFGTDDVGESKDWEEVMGVINQINDQVPESLKTLRKSINGLKSSANLINSKLQPMMKVCFLSMYFFSFFTMDGRTAHPLGCSP